MMDESEGGFEIVEKKCKSSSVNPSTAESSSGSMIANVPPPSALPSFIMAQSETTVPLPISVAESGTPPSSPSSTVTVNAETKVPKVLQTSVSVKSLSASSSTDLLPTKEPIGVSSPVTIQPLPPNSNASAINPKSNPSLEHDAKEEEKKQPLPDGDTWMGWIKGTVQSVGHKVAEKAKTSMDTMITTLDPQMKEFINSGGDVDIIVASDKEVKVNPVKEAFQKVFGKANVSGYASQFSEIASQPVGFDAAMKSAEGRINNLRSSGKIHPQQPIVSVEGFIVSLTENYWVEMSLLLLDDPWHDIILQTYTQPLPLPEKFIVDLKASTPETYPFKDSGFSKTVGQVASEHLNVHHSLWQETMAGVPRRELILTAAKVLAELYRTSLPSDVI